MGKGRRQRPGSAPTILDVANTAGVSPSAVSLALNGRRGLAEDTRMRILTVAKQLNYVPNLVARSLVERRSRCVAMMIPNFENRLFPEIAAGVDAVLRQHGYCLSITVTSDDPRMEAEGMADIRARGIDGIITSSALLGNDNIARLADSGYPVVCVVRRVPAGPRADYVVVDNVRGGYMAMEHLIRLGRTRIHLIRGPANNPVARERFRGATLAARDYGVALPKERICQGAFSSAFGHEAAVRFLMQPPQQRPDAIVAGNDDQALGTFEAVIAAGLEPGRDIAIVGFNNIETTALPRISITTVTQRSREMGDIAATRLIEVIEGGAPPDRPCRVVLEPNLVIRSSCGFDQARGYRRDDAPSRYAGRRKRLRRGEAEERLAQAGE